jgi:hypothetical protein
MKMSMGERKWRILRRALRIRGKRTGTFKTLRNWCRLASDEQDFHDLVAIGALEEVRPHKSVKDEGEYRITEKGRALADMGEVTAEDHKKFKHTEKPEPAKPKLKVVS